MMMSSSSKQLGALRSGALLTGKLKPPRLNVDSSKWKPLTKSIVHLSSTKVAVKSSLISLPSATAKKRRGKVSVKRKEKEGSDKNHKYKTLLMSVKPERRLRVRRIRPQTLIQYSDHVHEYILGVNNVVKVCRHNDRSPLPWPLTLTFRLKMVPARMLPHTVYTLFGWIALKCVPVGPERDQLPLSRAALTAWRFNT